VRVSKRTLLRLNMAYRILEESDESDMVKKLERLPIYILLYFNLSRRMESVADSLADAYFNDCIRIIALKKGKTIEPVTKDALLKELRKSIAIDKGIIRSYTKFRLSLRNYTGNFIFKIKLAVGYGVFRLKNFFGIEDPIVKTTEDNLEELLSESTSISSNEVLQEAEVKRIFKRFFNELVRLNIPHDDSITIALNDVLHVMTDKNTGLFEKFDEIGKLNVPLLFFSMTNKNQTLTLKLLSVLKQELSAWLIPIDASSILNSPGITRKILRQTLEDGLNSAFASQVEEVGDLAEQERLRLRDARDEEQRLRFLDQERLREERLSRVVAAPIAASDAQTLMPRARTREEKVKIPLKDRLEILLANENGLRIMARIHQKQSKGLNGLLKQLAESSGTAFEDVRSRFNHLAHAHEMSPDEYFRYLSLGENKYEQESRVLLDEYLLYSHQTANLSILIHKDASYLANNWERYQDKILAKLNHSFSPENMEETDRSSMYSWLPGVYRFSVLGDKYLIYVRYYKEEKKLVVFGFDTQDVFKNEDNLLKDDFIDYLDDFYINYPNFDVFMKKAAVESGQLQSQGADAAMSTEGGRVEREEYEFTDEMVKTIFKGLFTQLKRKKINYDERLIQLLTKSLEVVVSNDPQYEFRRMEAISEFKIFTLFFQMAHNNEFLANKFFEAFKSGLINYILPQDMTLDSMMETKALERDLNAVIQSVLGDQADLNIKLSIISRDMEISRRDYKIAFGEMLDESFREEREEIGRVASHERQRARLQEEQERQQRFLESEALRKPKLAPITPTVIAVQSKTPIVQQAKELKPQKDALDVLLQKEEGLRIMANIQQRQSKGLRGLLLQLSQISRVPFEKVGPRFNLVAHAHEMSGEEYFNYLSKGENKFDEGGRAEEHQFSWPQEADLHISIHKNPAYLVNNWEKFKDKIIAKLNDAFSPENIAETRKSSMYAWLPGIFRFKIIGEKYFMYVRYYEEGKQLVVFGFDTSGAFFSENNLLTDGFLTYLDDFNNNYSSYSAFIKDMQDGEVEELQDAAMKQGSDFYKGGIDLTQLGLNFGQGIKFHLDPAQLAQLQSATGLVPMIVNIQLLKNPQEFLGIN
jgi:hypothetical protein